MAQAVRLAARAVGRTPTPLGICSRRIRSRIGAAGAPTATAPKLARLVSRMWKSGRESVKQSMAEDEAKLKQELEPVLRRKASALGFAWVPKPAATGP